MRLLSALICGALFGLGLAVSRMSDPRKVLGFLDVSGNWDPSLLFVLGGAVLVTVVGFYYVRKRSKPMFNTAFEVAPAERVDLRLIIGAGLFGIGWGLSGYCPGPGIVSLARLAPDAVFFVATFLVGSALYNVTVRAKQMLL